MNKTRVDGLHRILKVFNKSKVAFKIVYWSNPYPIPSYIVDELSEFDLSDNACYFRAHCMIFWQSSKWRVKQVVKVFSSYKYGQCPWNGEVQLSLRDTNLLILLPCTVHLTLWLHSVSSTNLNLALVRPFGHVRHLIRAIYRSLQISYFSTDLVVFSFSCSFFNLSVHMRRVQWTR